MRLSIFTRSAAFLFFEFAEKMTLIRKSKIFADFGNGHIGKAQHVLRRGYFLFENIIPEVFPCFLKK